MPSRPGHGLSMSQGAPPQAGVGVRGGQTRAGKRVQESLLQMVPGLFQLNTEGRQLGVKGPS